MTGEISRMIQVAAGDSANVAEDTKHVAEGVGDTLQPAAEAQEAAGNLARIGEELRRLVGRFRFNAAGATGRAPGAAAPPRHDGSNALVVGLDFESAKSKHLAWKSRIRSFLDGEGRLTQTQAVSHRDCDLGRWLYGRGLAEYGHLKEMQTLEEIHKSLHQLIKSIVESKGRGQAAEAERKYAEMCHTSDRIIALFDTLKAKAGAAPVRAA